MTANSSDIQPIVEADEIEALYVQNATGMSYANGKLTLHSLAPTTLFFSDRPDRVTGHVTSQEFVGSWGKGKDSFAADPPNAALSIFQPDGVSDVVVELKSPQLDGGDLTYTVEILDGEMPAKGGPSSLFIDVIGRPLSPISICGVRRRQNRRA
jgi:hypothetical protein